MLVALLVGSLMAGLGAANNSRTPTMFVSDTTPPSAGVDVGYLWYDTTAGALKVAASIGPVVWTPIGGGSSSGGDPVPTGAILLMASGTCPAGYAEETTLDGRTPIGTLAANGDLGDTGGSDTLTPSGTINAQTFTGTLASLTHTGANVTSTFTGTALANHQHELPFQLVSGTSFRAISSATFGTGTSRAAVGGGTMTANTTSAAVAKDQAVSAGTPAGTIANTITQASAHSYTPQGTISAANFTGSSADNRSAFAKVLFCRKS